MRADVSAAFEKKIFDRAGGTCQCINAICGHHAFRCGRLLHGKWELIKRDPQKDYTPQNVVALCEACLRAIL
jgi:hypothetical protein